MVKSYLRYEREGSFGVIAALEGNVIYDKSGRFALAPALQDVVVWNLRQGNKVRELRPASEDKAGQVTALALSPDGSFVACGYSTGVVRVFRFATGALEVTLDGHGAAVEALAYRADGAVLASGARDTDIIVWDTVSQTGLFRLKGHKDAVTALAFLGESGERLASASKDTLVKVWDLETQHCVQTCVGHRNEVWALAVSPRGDRLLTGASDNQLRVWSVRQPNAAGDDKTQDDGDEGNVLGLMGSVFRQTNDRAARVAYSVAGDLVGVQSAGKTVEIYKLRSKEEIKRKCQRREKRAREKLKKKQAQEESASKSAKAAQKLIIPKETEHDDDDRESSATDELELLCVVRSSHRIKSFAFSPDVAKDGTTSMLLGLQNNSIETYTLTPQATESDARYAKAHALTLSGHRSDVRFVSISSDDQLLLSLSTTAVKIWNARSMQCIRTLSEGFTLALSAAFAPGNMHVVVGTKLGALLLFDLNSGECIWKDEGAHNGGAVWSIDVRPDGRGIVTGGADHHVNFWDFEMHQSSERGGLQLGLSHARMLKMSDDVLCVKFSNTKDARKLVVAVALLDCTVKVFHDDSLKFFVSLYGHKLPVMSMDISSDDALLVTASADKNVKLWGLDFGDCHKSIFAHQDSIMSVRFVRKTHYFFTASKDKTIAYWDGDHFERILKLGGQHFGEVWGVAVSGDGSFLVSCSQDRSICKYVRTEDQVFIEEEKEKELDQMFEDDLVHANNAKAPALGKEGDEDEGEGGASASATKRTIESVRAGESLMEAIDLAAQELEAIAEFERVQAKQAKEAAAKKKQSKGEEKEQVAPKATRPPNMLLLGYSPLKYVLMTLRRIRPHEMEEALIVLPFEYVERLIRLLLALISSQLAVEFCCQVLLHVLTLHHTAICNRAELFSELELLWQRLRAQLVAGKNRIGFNLAGLKYLKRQIDEERTGFVEEIAAAPSSSKAAGRKKRKTNATSA